jgi:hypothetical protein
MRRGNIVDSISLITILEQDLQQRSLEDEAFRDALLANPKEVLERDYPQWFPGGKVPTGVNINVATDDGQTLHLIVPEIALDQPFELDAAQLEEVQGGMPGIRVSRGQRLWGIVRQAFRDGSLTQLGAGSPQRSPSTGGSTPHSPSTGGSTPHSPAPNNDHHDPVINNFLHEFGINQYGSNFH